MEVCTDFEYYSAEKVSAQSSTRPQFCILHFAFCIHKAWPLALVPRPFFIPHSEFSLLLTTCSLLLILHSAFIKLGPLLCTFNNCNFPSHRCKKVFCSPFCTFLQHIVDFSPLCKALKKGYFFIEENYFY